MKPNATTLAQGSPRRLLCLSVLHTAIEDCRSPKTKPATRKQARAYLAGEVPEARLPLDVACDLAGVSILRLQRAVFH